MDIKDITEKRLKRGDSPRIYMPILETEGKAFQIDDHGNIRIRVKGRRSIWVGYEEIASMIVDGITYIGVSEYFKNVLPIECVLKVEKVDEDGESGFVKVKISEKEGKEKEEKILDIEEIKDLLSEVIDPSDYIYIMCEIVQTTKFTTGYVKIKMFAVPYDRERVGVEVGEVENFNILEPKDVQEYLQAALSDDYKIDIIID